MRKQKEMKPADFDKEWTARIDHAVEALKLGLGLRRPARLQGVPERGRQGAVDAVRLLPVLPRSSRRPSRVGEEAARAVPPTAQSARTAEYVIEAYNEYISESLRTGTTLADLSEQGGLVERMDKLAQFMIKQWPDEPPGDVARHMRGLLLIKQKKQPEAVEILAKVSPKYPSAIYVKSSLALAAAQVAQDREALAKAEPDKIEEGTTRQGADPVRAAGPRRPQDDAAAAGAGRPADHAHLHQGEARPGQCLLPQARSTPRSKRWSIRSSPASLPAPSSWTARPAKPG